MTVATNGPNNANVLVGAVSVTSNPLGFVDAGSLITLGGPDAAHFVLDNGGLLPCNLLVGASNIAANNYNITLSVTQ
jgi:hypothetical protein